MWCALNCQAYGTPPYYPLFVVLLPEASSLASISPLYSAFLWVLQYPSSILRSSCRLVSVKRVAEEQIFLFMRNRSRALLVIQNRSFSLFWEEEWGQGGAAGVPRRYKTSGCRYSDEENPPPPPVLRGFDGREFIPDSDAIDIAVMFL